MRQVGAPEASTIEDVSSNASKPKGKSWPDLPLGDIEGVSCPIARKPAEIDRILTPIVDIIAERIGGGGLLERRYHEAHDQLCWNVHGLVLPNSADPR